MSTDMRLLILTHLRAALERRDWRSVERAYALAGGVGAGDPGKRPGGTEKAPHGASEGAAA